MTRFSFLKFLWADHNLLCWDLQLINIPSTIEGRFTVPIQSKRSFNFPGRGFGAGFNILSVILAVGLLVIQLLSSVALAASQSYWIGIRSLAAALFPISVAVYFAFIARLQLPQNFSNAPIINNFVIFALWTMMLLGIDGSNQLNYFPLEELLYSVTIAFLIWRYKRQDSFKDLMACCYGILSGALAAIILFGWNPATM
jgi:hypothetical protein